MKPAYFDLSVRNLGRARVFFEKVLGWRFEKFPMPYEYYRIHAGPEVEAGIDGGMGAADAAPLSGGNPLTLITIPVPNLDEIIARVEAGGGCVVEAKTPIPGVGWYATCAEPGGLMFGLIQADASVN